MVAVADERLDCLALVTAAFGWTGGIAQYNRHFVSALAQVYRIEVLPRLGANSHIISDRLTQHRARRSRVAFALAATQLAVTRYPTMIFCGHIYMLPLGAFLARLTGATLMAQLHGIEAWDAPPQMVRACVGRADLWTAVSRYTRDRFLAWSNVDPACVRVLPNTVGETYLTKEKPQDLIDRHKLQGKRVILTVGRLASTERYKGHDRVIRALPEVLRSCPETVYLIVGAGDDISRLAAEAQKAGVSGQVDFVGQVPDDELPSYFQLADVFAMPSTGEGFGIVFLEAAASGVPVIAGNRDGSVDALADGAIGALIDPEDRGQLVAALIGALGSRSASKSINVKRFVFANFADHLNELVRHVL